MYNSIDPSDSSSSKLHVWRELVRIKESRAKIDRETAQLERSKHRNGYATVGSRTVSRSSSRVRGPAGEVSDDVWILPSLRPGSPAGSSRMRTASPAGSWRSTDGPRRPRGRDVLAMLEDDNAPLLLPPPPKSDSASMKDVEEISSSPRKKRPGYFSAREEDLDPLDMDMDDFITPARKKQRTSISLHQGPKFAALWEPSRRENWPLPEKTEDAKQEEIEKKEAEERERVKNELKDLKSPAFKLPPSARKETTTSMDVVEQPTPTKAVEKETDDLKFSFSKPSTSPQKTETNTFNFSVSEPPASPPQTETSNFKFGFSNPPTSPTKATENRTRKFSFSFHPASPTNPAEKDDESKYQLPMPTPGANLISLDSSNKDEEAIANGSPSKTATFMQSILSEKAPENQMEDISEKLNGVKSPETTQSSPQFQFSFPPTQSSSSEISQGTWKDGKSAGNGGFKFGSDTGLSGISASTSKPAPSSPPKETATITSPSVELPKFKFGMPKAVEESKVELPVETPVETKPALSFNFGQPKTEPPAATIFNATTEAKKDTTPAFGTPGGFGRFGGAFNKPEAEKSKVFDATSPVVAPSELPATNGTVKEPETKTPAFGSGISSGFNFGTKVTPAEPKTEPITPPVVPAIAVSQELDDSMDITDSPPTIRNTPTAGAIPPSFSFRTSAPTSAPTTTEPPKPYIFGQTNGSSEKPTLPSFGFAAKDTPGFGGSSIPPREFASPAPDTTFTGFRNGFPGNNGTEIPKPIEKSFFSTTTTTPSFGGPLPTEARPMFGSQTSTESKPLFGSQTSAESKPLFGSQTTAPVFGNTAPSLFGNTSSNQPSLISPPNGVASPPTSGFNFGFAAQTSSNPPPSFGSGGSTFSFTQTAPITNPFASNPAPAATSPAPFQGITSAPVSPQNQQQQPIFPVIPQFGAAAPTQPAAPVFGAAPSAANFQFSQNLPASPIFTLGAEMQRSSSDAGPANASPGGRKFAQPGRRRLNRRG